MKKVCEKTFTLSNDLDEASKRIEEIAGMCMTSSEDYNTELTIGLSEIILNAIEHGNLEIGYEEKTRLLDCGLYYAELKQRTMHPNYRQRKVTITVRVFDSCCEITIIDDGRGFDWRNIPDPKEKQYELHGRGITMARLFFDEVKFNEQGNQVTLIKRSKDA
ncbi:MAG: ATP-binding protein [Candidatus Auribacterota bacterium]